MLNTVNVWLEKMCLLNQHHFSTVQPENLSEKSANILVWPRVDFIVKSCWKEVRGTVECLLLPASQQPGPSPF